MCRKGLCEANNGNSVPLCNGCGLLLIVSAAPGWFLKHVAQHKVHHSGELAGHALRRGHDLGMIQRLRQHAKVLNLPFKPELGRPPCEYMADVLKFCRSYAEKFSPKSPNLLFMGGAGLGKTHLALAVADAVLERGYDVLYTSSAALAAQLGREHFDRDSEDSWLDACKEADLLILDDLGTEHITALTISVLYELINTRMLCHRPTVYTTNITDQGIFEARYTEKVASRMLGNCRMFKFFGEDQRLRR